MSKNKDQKESWRNFIRFLSSFKKEEELEALFDLFFTIEEKKDLINRYTIVQALMFQDKSQRDIAEHLTVSIAKITRGSNALKILSPEIYNLIKKKIGTHHEKSNSKSILRKS